MSTIYKTIKTNKMETLQALKTQLENLYNEMPRNFFEQSQRDKSAFLISRLYNALNIMKPQIKLLIVLLAVAYIVGLLQDQFCA